MRTLLDRHKARQTSRCFSRWFEHSKLIQIHSLYKEDMLANQEEFVYVTWQERERHQLALNYLERSKKYAETKRRAREYQKEIERKELEEKMKNENHLMPNEQGTQHDMSLESSKAQSQSMFSFNPQKLAQPTSVSFERIQRTITKLQQQFRKRNSERGSYMDDPPVDVDMSRMQGSTGTAGFVNGSVPRYY